jgi:hypothetical protein
MPASNEQKIFSSVEKIANKTRSFDVMLRDFGFGNSGYILVDLDENSKEKFYSSFKLLRKEIGGLKG